MPKKFTHSDGTETILKVKHYKYNEITLEKEEIKREFATLFLSVSNFCNMGCKMCFLTHFPISKCNQKPLSPQDIIQNNISICSNLKYPKIKISFMGMGEGIFLHKNLQDIATDLVGDKLFGVEVGTMLPFVSRDLKESLNGLKNGRLFYSLHSATQENRDKLITSKVSLKQAEEFLKDIVIKKVCHYTLIRDINDSDEEIRKAIKFCENTNAQLRILEFNKIGDLDITLRKKEVCNLLKNECSDYKLCYSSGKKIRAACGMFF